MSLTLSPDVEAAVERRAREEGVSPNDLLARTFGSNGASKVASNDPVERALEFVRRLRASDPSIPDPEPIEMLPGETPTLALFRKWSEEDALLTDEEVAAQNRLWEEIQQGMNESRIAEGRPILFKNVPNNNPR